jgi:hypothetical protein
VEEPAVRAAASLLCRREPGTYVEVCLGHALLLAAVGAKLTPVTVKVEPTELGILVLPVGFVKAGASNENEIVDVPIAKLVATTASGTGGAGYSSTATDAVFNLNGVTYTRSSNSVSDVIDGLALELVNTGTAVVKVSQGTDSSETVIKSLITAYNDLMASYKSMTANSSNSDTPGSFASNPTMLSFINEIKAKFAKGVSYGSDYSSSFSLSYVGIDMKMDGTLEFNADNYDSAIADGLQSTLAEGVTVGLSAYGYEKAKVTFRALSACPMSPRR